MERRPGQFSFLQSRSAQLAVSELIKHIYSAINNKKLFVSKCLDTSKTFNCIHHERLFNKMKSCGLYDYVIRWYVKRLG